MSQFTKRVLPGVLVLCLAGMSPANAQFFRGTIVGTVTDESGAVVVGAEIKLLNQGANATDTAKTGADGAYTFPALLPGIYRIEVANQGFKTQTVSDIRLEVNQTARIDVKLAVGEIVQRVEATASLQLLKTDTSDVGGVIANKTIVELPLNGRDYLQLARLPNFNLPNRTINSPTTGRITGAGSPRIVQFGLKLIL